MSASVADLLADVRQRGVQLPPVLAGALLLSAVRLSHERGEGLRPDLLLVDDAGRLSLKAGGDGNDAYNAPELRNGAVLPDDPRALVYAAGAFGYELVTLARLMPDKVPGAELRGPLARVIRKAVALDRNMRYRSLADMAEAIEKIHPVPTPDEEKLILSAVAQKGTTAQKLSRMATPSDAAGVHPVFARQWDPLEAPSEVFFAPPEAPPASAPEPLSIEPGVIEMGEDQARAAHVAAAPADAVAELRALLDAERKERKADLEVLESRLQNFARLGARILAIEGQIKLLAERTLPDAVVESAPAPAPAASALATRGILFALGSGAAVGAAGVFALMLAARPTVRSPPVAPLAVAALQPSEPPAKAPQPSVAAPAPAPQVAEAKAAEAEARPAAEPDAPSSRAARLEKRPRKTAASAGRAAATAEAAKGDRALRAFDTQSALSSFEAAARLDPSLPAAHRGLGMVYVLQGKNAEAKIEYQKYLQLSPEAPDADQIKRLLER